MAKETMIVFVYDTEHCKDESDDPVEAVLYFHPSWVSDVQKLSLCGQLMGTTHFLKENFFKPKIISLQNGKFILKEFGRFILAVGTDRNFSDSLLQHRAELLTSLVKCFHRDIHTIYTQFSVNGQYKNLSDKLYHIFETYLPILQYNGNVFQNVLTLRLPKSASNIFLDAIQTLQSCQQTKGVLGGAILYHNKVVATQLSADITKNFVLTDPYRIKSTAEPISVGFHVPIGVQMIVVYISNREYRKLFLDAQKAQNVVTQNLSNPPVPFQYPKRKIKRDKSLIFTNIPEEGSCEASSNSVVPDVPKAKAVSRPNHLPLRFKNVTSKEIPESGIASINFDETDSYPEFIGRTSICSTPMTENKVLHGNVMSICANPTENLIINQDKSPSGTPSVKRNGIKIDFEKFFSNFISNPYKMERRSSLADIQESLKKISKRMSLRQLGIGLPKLDVNKNGTETPDYVDDIDNKKINRTITDPTYPVFNSDGEPISKSLFQEFLDRYYTSWDQKSKNDEKISKLLEEFKEFDNELQQLDSKFKDRDDVEVVPQENSDEIHNIPTKLMQNRKTLTLPLKPLNELTEKEQNNSVGIFEKKKISGIQLTPLLAKLSILALNEERSSGFCSWDTTPGLELATPIDGSKVLRRKSSLRPEDVFDCSDDDNFQKVALYVCGQQNMTLLLLLEEGGAQRQTLVQTLFDTCVSRLTRIETHLNQTLNVNVDGDKNEGGYSYICVDPQWDTLQRGGPWAPVDMMALEHMHKDLNMQFPITDLVLRTDDSVLYSYKCGRTEIFYKQPANPQAGLPPPADTMGTIAMRAKRRLERDHSFILL